MGSIILDNWTLVSSFPLLLKNTEYSPNSALKRSMSNLLMGIILWDEVRFTPNNHTNMQLKSLPTGKSIEKLKALCNPIDTINFGEFVPATKYFNDDSDYLDWFTENQQSLFQRTKQYLDLSNHFNTGYFPHHDRAVYMEEHKLLEERFNRYEILESIDKELINYYHELNNDSRFNLLRFTYPVLYNYISYQATSPLDELSIALELRERDDVVELRKSLNDLDIAIKKGDRPFILSAQKQLDELTEIIASSLPQNQVIETNIMKVGLTLPVIGGGINLDGIPVKKKAKTDNSYQCNNNGVLNLTFLTDVVNFGLGN